MNEREQLQTAVRALYEQPYKETDFSAIALRLFRYQYRENAVYRQFVQYLNRNVDEIQQIEQIPFLPIEVFKRHALRTGEWAEQLCFSSSGTTGQQTSRHYIRQPEWYEEIAVRGFESQYGALADWLILALLPSYLEREGSSLIYMLRHFMQRAQPESGFYLYNTQQLVETLEQARKKGKRVLLWGVGYALLDLAEQGQRDWSDGVVVLETGGMKGRRQELVKEELHSRLCRAFGVQVVHSEYGMTELLSQGYSQGAGVFQACPSLRVLVRDATDPLAWMPVGKAGALNLIDLANIDSCAFIATDDLGKVRADGRFEVLGRLDASDVRGCNLLV